MSPTASIERKQRDRHSHLPINGHPRTGSFVDPPAWPSPSRNHHIAHQLW
jgi:hypothetical protein